MSDAVRKAFGTRVPRIEDLPLLRGNGQFVDDIKVDNALHAHFVRSPHAHAKILSIDADLARAHPGVVAVLTIEELSAVLTNRRMPLGFAVEKLPSHCTPWVLSSEEVCFVGEPIAIIVATSRYIAEDAEALVQIEFEPLPVVTDCRHAIQPDSPLVRSTSTSNILKRFEISYGDVNQAFSGAAHIFREELWQHRGAAHPIEGRGVVARPDTVMGSLTVWSSTQMPHELAATLSTVLGIPERLIRVITPDVGGGFGAKFLVYPEEVAITAAAKLIGRTVKWIEDRREHFVSAIQERDQHWNVEIAVDADARIFGIRGVLIHDQGAYTPQGLNLPYNSATSVSGPYIVPSYKLDVFVADTNKVYTIPVRGAGYPEAAFTMERLLDRVARELKLDRAEVRRRNLVPAEKMPYAKPLVNRAGAPLVLDSGDYPLHQQQVLDHIGYASFTSKQSAARERGKYIGIGFAHGVKGTGRGPFESGLVRVSASGLVNVCTGALAMGQGTKTTLAQICADQLGVAVDQIEVIAGDTAYVSLGLGGFASRQAVTAGSSVHLAAKRVREKALKVASQLLEVDEADLTISNGRVHVVGAEQLSVSLGEVARALRGVPGYSLPADVGAGLEENVAFRTDSLAFAHSFHAVEVQVDIAIGAVTILRYVALQDSGNMINPLIVEGQVHGGVVHGLGNALFEFMNFDSNGQPTTTTFAEYLLPTATEVPALEVLLRETPSPLNPIGVKGVGEGGTVPVAAAVISAIEDALSPFGVRISRAPVSPLHILELLRDKLPILSKLAGDRHAVQQ